MSCLSFVVFFFFKQKTAYELRISDWSSDVCSSDLGASGTKACWTMPRHRSRSTASPKTMPTDSGFPAAAPWNWSSNPDPIWRYSKSCCAESRPNASPYANSISIAEPANYTMRTGPQNWRSTAGECGRCTAHDGGCYRSEEHTSELQSLMRISYAVFCLKKKKNKHTNY